MISRKTVARYMLEALDKLSLTHKAVTLSAY